MLLSRKKKKKNYVLTLVLQEYVVLDLLLCYQMKQINS